MKITHVVMLRYEPGYYDERLHEFTLQTFFGLKDAGIGVRGVTVDRNCYEREGNYDVIISLELDSPDILPIYLRHPLHQEYVRRDGAHLAARASIDYERK